mgnify:CR=1 FL=1
MDDLISRQDAIEAVQNRHMMLSKEKVLLINDLEKLPTAEPRRGKWIRTGSGSLYDHYECSECGKAPKWECMGDNRWKIAFTGFCPNCGADMRGEQDG